MNKKMLVLATVLITLFLLPLTLQAESGKFGLGARMGVYKSADADGHKLYGGAQARWRIFPALSVEGSIDYRVQESYPDNKKITSYPILATALFYPIPDAKYSPYLLGGLGWYYSKVEDKTGSSTVHTPGLHVGAGLDIPLSPEISFNADFRYYFLNYSDQKVKDLKTNGYIISAGLTFYLW
ncbi:MAG: porin family protein [Thermodesulfobacteriota bacterium]